MVPCVAMFAFRVRAYAAAHFALNDVMTVRWPDAVAVLQSEYTGGTDGLAYPVTLHGEIRSEYASLEEAERRLGASIGNTLPIVALAANAAIADPLPIAVHGLDITTPQPFVAYHSPDAKHWFPPGDRQIEPGPTLALMTAVGTHPQTEILHRAIELYRRALGHWVPEYHVLAGEFLYICAETLSRFLIESRAAIRGLTPKNLVRAENAGSVGALRRIYLRDEVFHGDQEALDAMDAASNGFEHGYMAMDEVRGLVDGVLERSMSHVRRALIGASGIDDANEARLLDTRLHEPRGLVPVMRLVRGELARQDCSQPPPIMDVASFELSWEVEQLVAPRRADGKVAVSWRNKLTATKLPPNTSLRVQEFGMRAANLTLADEPPIVDAEPSPQQE